ncbi:glutathione S-transferase family protein [Alteraurantiacibacter aquimixticola]|uniref:Glutathione S-transferase family protein n=1 Tax=Alteraurantiacibacter aquimixticola TaxID=2489173 RepID=A0A4T3F1H4_9SPHN|nr:glutathione S-transferase family protein [Alteraurantiacibacter aquimixticola]TIX50918.1 glutathione S-transferase family protein [Alteraurantiacibacter aquimixticola]
MLKLWFAPNTCARVSMTALEEIGQPYGTGLIAFMAGEHRKPEFLAVNPSGKVPALETPQGVLVQNGAILSWLAEAYPDAGLLPPTDNPFEKAQQRAEIFRCSSDLHPLVTRFVMPQMISTEMEDAPRIRAKAEELLRFQLAPLETRLAQDEFLLGGSWSILDAYLAWIWFRITGSGFDGDAFPALRGHHQRATERPSAKAALAREAEAEKDLDGRGLLFRPPFDKGAGK